MKREMEGGRKEGRKEGREEGREGTVVLVKAGQGQSPTCTPRQPSDSTKEALGLLWMCRKHSGFLFNTYLQQL